jgi:hypothetical protein
MIQNSSWWHLQLFYKLKDLTKAYNRFLQTADVSDLEIAEGFAKEICAAYELRLDLLDLFQIGGSLRAR